MEQRTLGSRRLDLVHSQGYIQGLQECCERSFLVGSSMW